MQPGFDLKFRTMIKALSETVLPAVDAGNKAATEQIQVTIGLLQQMREQLDYAHWYEVVDAKSMGALADKLAALTGKTADKAKAVADETRAIAARYDVTLSGLRGANEKLRETISNTIESAYGLGKKDINTKIQALVLTHAEEQLTRERAFVAAAKFDVFPDTLRSIEDSLKAARF